MTQYSIFTHGTALQVERPETVREILRVGGGTAVTLHLPILDTTVAPDAHDDEGPGTWMHLPLTSTLTTFGRSNPKLVSVTLLYECRHCRIADVHVWDGGALVYQFNGKHLRGSSLAQRNSSDINPGSAALPASAFSNTLALPSRHEVFSAIGVSFFVRWFRTDLHGDEYDLKHGRFPDSVVLIAAVGAQYVVD